MGWGASGLGHEGDEPSVRESRESGCIRFRLGRWVGGMEAISWDGEKAELGGGGQESHLGPVMFKMPAGQPSRVDADGRGVRGGVTDRDVRLWDRPWRWGCGSLSRLGSRPYPDPAARGPKWYLGRGVQGAGANIWGEEERGDTVDVREAEPGHLGRSSRGAGQALCVDLK